MGTQAFPQRFGRYWLHEKIGHGGMAEVLRASVGPDPHGAELACVIKRLHPHLLQHAGHRQMFAQEQELAEILRHKNLVATFEADAIDDHPYIAMELIRGSDIASLTQALAARHLSFAPDLAVYIAAQMLEALDYVHRKSDADGVSFEIVHGDVTPANVFLTFDGQVKLADFGIARMRGGVEPFAPKMLRGKAAYMPPEVLAGVAPSQRDDLWAVAICLWEMLCGKRAFGNATEAEITKAAAPPKLNAPPGHVLASDKALSNLLHAALHGNPKKRPDTAAAFLAELRAAAAAVGFHAEQDTLARFVLATLGDVEAMALGFEASVKDGLTATFTYRHFLEHLQVEIERSRRYGRLFSVLFVDVDGFKIHVAKAGVAATDRLLTHLGEQLTGPRARLRVPDMVARRGADTFCILLPETDTSGAEVAARRLVSTIAEADWPQVHPGLTHVTISVGVASFPLHGKTAGALIQAAAMAGHQAQCQGGNRTVVAGVEFTELKEKIASGEATAQEVSRFEALRQDYDNAQAAHTKRRHHRADLALAVRFESQEALIEAYTDDVGAGGLRLVVDGEFGAGQVIDLCVSLPNDPQPVQATAVVVWARRHEHVVGVEFIEMTYADRERIEALVWAMAEPL